MKFYTILFFIICVNTIQANEKTQKKNANSIHISDSLSTEIENASDTLALDNVFSAIKKHRRTLKQNYLPLLHKFVSKSGNLNYPKGEMKALDRIGLQHRFDESYDSALIYHNKSLKLALQLNDSTQLYYNYNNLGQVYRMQDLNVLAITYFHKALKISDATKNYRSSSFTMNSLGATYVVQKDYNQAMYYFKESTKIAKQRDDKRTIAYNYGSMGEVFLLQQKNDSAMFYFQESKKLILELGGKRGYAVAEHLIAQAHFALGQLSEAEKYFNIALRIHNKDKNARYQALCNAYMGKIKTQQHKTDSAEWYLLKGKEIATEINSRENLILINEALFELYKTTNQWQKAVQALQESHSYQDSILNSANAREIQALEIAYEIQQKEQKIKLLSAENKIKSQSIKLGIALIFGLLISIVLGAYMYFFRKKQSALLNDKLKQQLMISQMNPHFIFNALASIQNYMYKNDARTAISYLGNFASLTRSILNNSSQESVTLEEEISTLTNYLELEKMRLSIPFEFQINTPDDIEADFIQLPPMMIQPFIENAIKHGLKSIDYNGLLVINISELENHIEVEITDNGIGINEASKNADPKHKSKATEIFKQRLNILKKKYRNIPDPEIIDLSVENKTGTKVLIHLPIINE